jgi:hypothetical protein
MSETAWNRCNCGKGHAPKSDHARFCNIMLVGPVAASTGDTPGEPPRTHDVFGDTAPPYGCIPDSRAPVSSSTPPDTFDSATEVRVPIQDLKALEDILATHLPDGVWQSVDSLITGWRLGAKT